jgi:hypothetical protein
MKDIVYLELQKRLIAQLNELSKKRNLTYAQTSLEGNVLYMYKEDEQVIFTVDVCYQYTKIQHLPYHTILSAYDSDYMEQVLSYFEDFWKERRKE